MSEAEALYIRDGDAFVGTPCTKGSWHDNGQSGGAVLALLGHVVEEVPSLVPMSLTRLSVDIVRPVPVGERLYVEPTIIREGKKIQVVDLVVRTSDIETTRARVLRIRDRDISGLEGMPRSTTSDNPAARLPPPEHFEGVDKVDGVAGFLKLGAELRRSFEPIDGYHAVWVRLRVPVVAGEPVRPTSLAALPLDMVNLIGIEHDDVRRARAINPDVSGHVFRPPASEWVALTGHTYYGPGVGHGMSMALMSDEHGVFGLTSTSQIVEPI
jgi:hypothetical protein